MGSSFDDLTHEDLFGPPKNIPAIFVGLALATDFIRDRLRQIPGLG